VIRVLIATYIFHDQEVLFNLDDERYRIKIMDVGPAFQVDHQNYPTAHHSRISILMAMSQVLRTWMMMWPQGMTWLKVI